MFYKFVFSFFQDNFGTRYFTIYIKKKNETRLISNLHPKNLSQLHSNYSFNWPLFSSQLREPNL